MESLGDAFVIKHGYYPTLFRATIQGLDPAGNFERDQVARQFCQGLRQRTFRGRLARAGRRKYNHVALSMLNLSKGGAPRRREKRSEFFRKNSARFVGLVDNKRTTVCDVVAEPLCQTAVRAKIPRQNKNRITAEYVRRRVASSTSAISP